MGGGRETSEVLPACYRPYIIFWYTLPLASTIHRIIFAPLTGLRLERRLLVRFLAFPPPFPPPLSQQYGVTPDPFR